MKFIVFYFLFFVITLSAQELRVKANKFSADENKGISIFEGNVNIKKSSDELNASKVIIYTNKKHKPTKYVADGKVSFYIKTKNGSIYKGHAQKVIFKPKEKEYYFYKDVYLSQVDDTKVIIGDEVVLKVEKGKAYATGKKKEPVIMIFNIPESKDK
jgi:lipopolysaccharide export system protein LptA